MIFFGRVFQHHMKYHHTRRWQSLSIRNMLLFLRILVLFGLDLQIFRLYLIARRKTFCSLKGIQRPAAFAIVCFCFCEFCTVSYSGNCAEQVANLLQGMLVFMLPLNNIASFHKDPQGYAYLIELNCCCRCRSTEGKML